MPFDNTLLMVLDEEVRKEKWKKKAKIKGRVIEKRITKKGSFMLTVKTKRTEYEVVVPKYKKNEFDIAKSINKNDFIFVIGDKQLGDVVFCDEINKVGKESLGERTDQTRLHR